MGPEHGRLAQVETMLLGNREDVVHTRGGMDVVANGLVIPHLARKARRSAADTQRNARVLSMLKRTSSFGCGCP